MSNHSVSDLLTRIRNSQAAGHSAVRVPFCKSNRAILEVLVKEGFVGGFAEDGAEHGLVLTGQGKVPTKKIKAGKRSWPELIVSLKYSDNGEPMIVSAKTVSTPGRRIFVKADALPKVSSGLGISLVSTSQGVMSDREARKHKVGGELLARIG